MDWSTSMNARSISSMEMSEYKYSGRNIWGKDIPSVLQSESLLEPSSETIFPCRVYDPDGNLKYEISREEIIDKEIYIILKKVKELKKGKHG